MKTGETTGKNHSLSYAAAGVDIHAGNTLVKRIAPLAAATKRAGTMDGLGGFGGLFDLKACGYDDPILVSATDGVGTKLLLAQAMNRHGTIGIDLVAMCVNDLLVQGAAPLFFLDYFACGALAVDQAAEVIAGIAEGCQQANCQLIGGETAEMPGMYAPGHYDLAGFAVGAVERAALLPNKPAMQVGDAVVGIASSGLHSNGFSLFRRLLEETSTTPDAALAGAAISIGEAALIPTRIYIRSVLPLLSRFNVRALAHITGGGLLENIPRVLPENLACAIDTPEWPLPPVLQWVVDSGLVAPEECYRVFNMGIGLVMMVPPAEAESLCEALTKAGEVAFIIGELTPRRAGDAPCQIAGINA